MKIFASSALSIALCLAVSGCGEPPAANLLPPATSKDAAPAVEQSKAEAASSPAALSDDMVAFAADLYGAMGKRGGNMVFSPHAIAMALGMVTLGAGGDTAQQLRTALHWNMPPGSLPAGLKAWRTTLADSAASNADLHLSVANAIWGAAELRPTQPFQSALEVGFGSGWRSLDIAAAPEAARAAINDWVSEQTHGAIDTLLQPGQLDPGTRMVATSALYLSAPWQRPFLTQAIRDKAFYNANGAAPQVPMMTQMVPLQYAETDAFQAVDLAYTGGQLRFTVLLPKESGLQNGGAFTAAALRDVLSNFEQRQVQLSLPKFKVAGSYSLRETLQALGVHDAFEAGRADFFAIDGERDLALGDVIHQTVLDVNENGTQAAAATSVGVIPTALPAETAIMLVDKPFMFLIRDTASGTLLFVGRIDHL